jgi:hypothetical protein
MGSGLSTVTRLTKAINAALAAERKEFEELEQLYRENNQDHYKEVGDLQQQLDAERSKYDRAQEQIRFQQQQLAKVKA